jgi:epoxyqueuosine reductase
MLQPNGELLRMTKEQWNHLSEDDYRRLFKGSAVKRAKYSGLMRNIQAVHHQSEITHHEKD